MSMTNFDPYEELMTQRKLIEDLIRHTNKLIKSNNTLTDRVEYLTSECAILQTLLKTSREQIRELEDVMYASK